MAVPCRSRESGASILETLIAAALVAITVAAGISYFGQATQQQNQMSALSFADAMRALVEGRLDAWPGLPRGCGRQAAEAAFGPGEGGPDGVAPLEGTATAFRRYGPSPRVPHAVQVWLRDEAILAIEVAGLVLLVAIVAAIALTVREPKDAKRQNVSKQINVRRQDRVRLVKMQPVKEEPEAAQATDAAAAGDTAAGTKA